jgi:hypothetical protein
MPAAGQTPASEHSKPADERRFHAGVAVKPGETEGRIDGSAIQLVRVVLSDNGPVVREDGATYSRPDVVCAMRSEEAHELAGRLTGAATHAERGLTRTAGGHDGASQIDMTPLRHIERVARQLRSAEVLVKDRRLALEQEIERTIETTDIPVSEMARVAGPSRTIVYDVSSAG